MSLVVFENPMYTNSFSVIELEAGPGYTDQASTIVLEAYRIRILTNKDKSREINFTRRESIICSISSNKSRDLFLLKVPKERDFIIRFMSASAREACVNLLQTHAINTDKIFEVKEVTEEIMLKTALTPKKRNTAIEEFLKSTFR